MDVLKFAPELSHKVQAAKQFQTIRKSDKAIAVGERLQFAEISGVAQLSALGQGICIGTADVELSEHSLSILCRKGGWSDEEVNGIPQPKWTLAIDTAYRDGSWGLASFTAVPDKMDKFAVDEGFENFARLVSWFSHTYRLPFKGKLIVCEVEA